MRIAAREELEFALYIRELEHMETPSDFHTITTPGYEFCELMEGDTKAMKRRVVSIREIDIDDT